MPSTREIKRRIRSVQNIGQITRALEAVSASRVRKAQAKVLASRAYSQKAIEILQNVQAAGGNGDNLHPLLTVHEQINKVMIVLITSDRGLAGAFNTNIIRVTQRFDEQISVPVEYVTIGRKGREALIRAGEDVVAEFSDIDDDLRITDVQPMARVAKDAFTRGEVDAVYIAYTDFINTLTQRPAVFSWLPLVPRRHRRGLGGPPLEARRPLRRDRHRIRRRVPHPDPDALSPQQFPHSRRLRRVRPRRPLRDGFRGGLAVHRPLPRSLPRNPVSRAHAPVHADRPLLTRPAPIPSPLARPPRPRYPLHPPPVRGSTAARPASVGHSPDLQIQVPLVTKEGSHGQRRRDYPGHRVHI